MEAILVKLFATALALSEVTTQPQAVKTHFDAVQDRTEVVQLLRDGCAHMRQAIESINLDELIATALTDSNSTGRRNQSLSWHQFRRPEHRLPPVLQE
jgi:penicillin-binding protein 1A